MRKRPQKDNGGVQCIAPAVPENREETPGTINGKQEHTSTVKRKDYKFLIALAANTSDAIITLDENYRVRSINPAVTTTLAWSPEDALGQPCTSILRCQNLNHTELCGTSSCPLTRVLQQKQPLANEELIIGTAPEHSCEVSVNATPIEIENTQYVVLTARDISALKMANRVRSNFVSMVSHELRTPLNSVHGFIDLLVQGHMGELTEEQRKYLGYAQEGVQQLISIVEDILFLTRSDSGQFEIKPQQVNLRVLSRQVLNSLQPQALKASVILNKDIPSPSPLLYVNPQHMKQVLNNLVMNAIKFTPPGGTVTIRSRPYDERFLMISVSDTGFGIPFEDRPHIFERFYQSNHARQSRMGGYGLGLSIAKLIVEQHGGTIGFDSVLEHGTTFYFTAPLYTEQ